MGDWRFNIVRDEEKFKKYLTDRGAVVLPPTNPWEVVRFRTQNGVSVVYTNKHGHLTYTGESAKAYEFFKSNRKWTAVDRKRQSLKAQKVKIAERDGKICFFHGEKLDYDKLTIEHLLEFSKGGSDHIANLCLACEECNKAVVGMSITEKMLYRDKKLWTPMYSIDPSYVTPTILDNDIEIHPDDVENGVLKIRPGEPIRIIRHQMSDEEINEEIERKQLKQAKRKRWPWEKP